METSTLKSGVQKTLNKFDATGGTGREGQATKLIESQTSKLPSIGFLALGLLGIGASAWLEFFGKKRQTRDYGVFVGLWVPTFLLFGIYNKLVKIEGSDRYSHQQREAA